MNRSTGAALVAYAVLLGSFATPLYEPLGAGRDDSWAMFVVLVGAHVGVGVMVRRAWVLLLPVALAVAGFFIAGAEGMAWAALMVQAPVLITATTLGWMLGLSLKRRRLPVAVAAFTLAALPGVWASVETAKRGRNLSPAVQAQLPGGLYSLCQHAETPGELRKLRRSVELLIELLQRRPNDLVTNTYYYEDGDDVRRDITIKEFAEEGLGDLDSQLGEQQLEGLDPGADRCASKFARQIRAALQ